MNKDKKAVVLLNMGGPRNKEELEMFLRNMFNDENILTIKNNLIRSMVASLIVFARKNSAWENYEEIGGKSPINDLTEELINKLQNVLGEEYFVTQAMRYTPPFAPKCVGVLKQKGIKDVILFPLYPQYSTTTTKSSLDDFYSIAKNNFNIKTVEPFYKNELYNDAICEEIISKVEDEENTHLIFSAHGLPVKIVQNGDPYQKQVEEHKEILKNMLRDRNVKFASISLAYQSKVGPMKWLEPSLNEKLKEFENKNVLIYPISFIVDNSETDFELSIEYKKIAEELNIASYEVCKCVNSNDKFIKSIKDMIENV